MKHITLAVVLAVAGCSKEDNRSKPVTCEVAGKMVAKRLGEFANKVRYTPEQRAKLDKNIAAAVTTRCTEDKWDEVPLGCLGAMATIDEGTVDAAKYNDGIDICVKAIGDANWKKMEDAVGAIVRASRQ